MVLLRLEQRDAVQMPLVADQLLCSLMETDGPED